MDGYFDDDDCFPEDEDATYCSICGERIEPYQEAIEVATETVHVRCHHVAMVEDDEPQPARAGGGASDG